MVSPVGHPHTGWLPMRDKLMKKWQEMIDSFRLLSSIIIKNGLNGLAFVYYLDGGIRLTSNPDK